MLENTNLLLAQSVELPDLSGLPPFAQGVLYTMFFLCATLAVIVPRMGFLHGKNDTKKTDNAPVAAVIVDPTALNNHTAALNKLAEVIERGLTRTAEATDDFREEIRIAREVMKATSKN